MERLLRIRKAKALTIQETLKLIINEYFEKKLRAPKPYEINESR